MQVLNPGSVPGNTDIPKSVSRGVSRGIIPEYKVRINPEYSLLWLSPETKIEINPNTRNLRKHEEIELLFVFVFVYVLLCSVLFWVFTQPCLRGQSWHCLEYYMGY